MPYKHLNVSQIQCSSEMEVLSQPIVKAYFTLLHYIIFVVVLLDFEHKSTPSSTKILLENFVNDYKFFLFIYIRYKTFFLKQLEVQKLLPMTIENKK